MFDKISTALMALWASNTLIQTQYNYEASNLEGFPALTLCPSANESDYATTTENRRVYAFVVRLYVERMSGSNNEKSCETTMRQLVDTVLDKVDKYHSTLSVESQTGYSFLFMEAAPSRWGYAGRENNLRVAEILVKLHFDVDVNLIS